MTEGADQGTNGAAQGPLHGVRVLDFTSVTAGPYCTRLLADMGADVIKIEPADGDANRAREPLRDGESAQYSYHNAGKRSVVLDLKRPAGRDAAVGLAAVSDVVVENWRPGVAGRLGVGYRALSAVRPGLVYCSISGFGQTGPEAGRASYASVVEAEAGLALAQQAVDGSPRPPVCGLFMADLLADDPRFSTGVARNGGWFALLGIIEEWTSVRSTAECERVLSAAGVPFARFRTVAEALGGRREAGAGTLATVRDGAGEVQVVQPPFRMPGVGVRPSVSPLGADTAAVLSSLLSYDDARIAACAAPR